MLVPVFKNKKSRQVLSYGSKNGVCDLGGLLSGGGVHLLPEETMETINGVDCTFVTHNRQSLDHPNSILDFLV